MDIILNPLENIPTVLSLAQLLQDRVVAIFVDHVFVFLMPYYAVIFTSFLRQKSIYFFSVDKRASFHCCKNVIFNVKANKRQQ